MAPPCGKTSASRAPMKPIASRTRALASRWAWAARAAETPAHALIPRADSGVRQHLVVPGPASIGGDARVEVALSYLQVLGIREECVVRVARRKTDREQAIEGLAAWT